jgi:hypothetical protein
VRGTENVEIQEQLRDRKAFYARFGGRPDAGLGRAELDFTEWLRKRGALAPLDGLERPGSAWWRAVNARLLDDQKHARRVHDGGVSDGRPTLDAWLAFIREPSAETWYCAHNESVVRGYLEFAPLAAREGAAEQKLMNIVLTRVLYAHALCLGERLGPLGRFLADPASGSIPALLSMTMLYPDRYPIGHADLRGPVGRIGSFIDERFTKLEGRSLYKWAAKLLSIPELEGMLIDGKPQYPRSAMRKGKKRIAVLGGGISSLAAVTELTTDPNWQEHYDITVY